MPYYDGSTDEARDVVDIFVGFEVWWKERT